MTFWLCILAYTVPKLLHRVVPSPDAIPKHLLQNTLVVQPNLLDNGMGKKLHALLLKEGEEGYYTNVDDGLPILHEHIGEAQPLNEQGFCDHKFLVVSKDRTKCVLPGRIDIGR